MSISLVVSSTPTGVTSGTATTVGVDTTGANFLAIYVATALNDASQATISDSKGNTYIALTNSSSAGGTRQGCWFYVASPTVGTSHTFSGQAVNDGFISIFPSAWAGVNAAPLDQQNTNSNESGTSITTGSVTPTTDNQLLLAAVSDYNGANDTYAVDSSFTLLDKLLSVFVEGGATAYQIQTSATTRNPSFTVQDGTAHVANIATFKETGAAAAGGVLVNGALLAEGRGLVSRQ